MQPTKNVCLVAPKNNPNLTTPTQGSLRAGGCEPETPIPAPKSHGPGPGFPATNFLIENKEVLSPNELSVKHRYSVWSPRVTRPFVFRRGDLALQGLVLKWNGMV